MPDIYTLCSTACLPGRARGGSWSEDHGPTGAITRAIAASAPPYDGWVWTHDPAEPACLRDIWYQDGTWDGETFTPGHRVKVFDKVEWRGVAITGTYKDPATPDAPAWELTDTEPGREEMRGLPLTAEYLVGRFSLIGGSVETNALWPIDWGIDSALVLLFAYELRFKSATGRRTGACDLAPVAAVDYKHRSFMPTPGVEGLGAAENKAFRRAVEGVMSASGSGATTEVQLSNPRALVLLSFAGCEPRADFEPGEIVTMTRMHPHALVLTTIPMHQTAATVTVRRPARSSMYEPPKSDDVESHTEKIKSLLVADTNEARGTQWFTFGLAPPLPYWYNMFDYYRVLGDSNAVNAARGQAYPVVRRSKGARTIKGAARWQGSVLGMDSEGGVDVSKVARQGAYDNLHMSPRMVAPEALMAKYPALRDQLKEVAQAPFCDCDCVHIHWRWGALATKRSNQGWGTQGPHTAAGAPMVPPNQSVKLYMDADNQFTYEAVAKPAAAMQWQVFFHHGTALALRIGETWGQWVMTVMASTGVNTSDAREESLEMPWSVRDAATQFMSVFYYRMRYHTKQGGQEAVERLTVLDLNALENG